MVLLGDTGYATPGFGTSLAIIWRLCPGWRAVEPPGRCENGFGAVCGDHAAVCEEFAGWGECDADAQSRRRGEALESEMRFWVL